MLPTIDAAEIYKAASPEKRQEKEWEGFSFIAAALKIT